MRDTSCSRIGRFNAVNMSTPLKVIYRFNAIQINSGSVPSKFEKKQLLN